MQIAKRKTSLFTGSFYLMNVLIQSVSGRSFMPKSQALQPPGSAIRLSVSLQYILDIAPQQGCVRRALACRAGEVPSGCHCGHTWSIRSKCPGILCPHSGEIGGSWRGSNRGCTQTGPWRGQGGKGAEPAAKGRTNSSLQLLVG